MPSEDFAYEIPIEDAIWPPEQAEQSYIGALLQRDDANQVMWRSAVTPEHFESGDLGAIYKAMVAIRDRGDRVHYLTVAEQLANAAQEYAMWNSTNHYAVPDYVEFYAEQILARFRRRTVGVTGQTLTEIAASTPGPSLDLAVEEAVANVRDVAAVQSVQPTDVTLMQRLFGEREHEETIPSPWRILDEAITGFRPGTLYALSGDTGSGKSAIALQMAYALAQRGTCLYFSMEMSEGELQDRLVAQQTGTDLRMIEQQRVPAGPVQDKVLRFIDQTIDIVFDCTPTVSVADVRRRALGIGKLGAIVIDYLMLMEIDRQKGENPPDAIARVTKALKVLATDLHVPVILLSQLNREAARSGRPTRHHLYGSSGISNDAGVILILHRENPQNRSALTLIVDKNRYGEEVELDLTWDGYCVRARE